MEILKDDLIIQQIKEKSLEELKDSDIYINLQKKLANEGLCIYDIDPDGDCQFASVAHQLSNIGIRTNKKMLRAKVVEFLKSNIAFS